MFDYKTGNKKMKIMCNHLVILYFINNNMSFNIHEEHIKLIQVIDDKTLDFLKFAKKYSVRHFDSKINFLWKVLILTVKHPEVELYLKDLLNYFTVDELEKLYDDWSIFHYMSSYAFIISLNAFEIIINRGININIKTKYHNTAAHLLLQFLCNEHITSILHLLIKYGFNLDVVNVHGKSVLDELIYFGNELSEEKKNCIMTLIDFGGKTNVSIKNNAIYDFVKYYQCSSIKPATKNENIM